MQNEQVVLKTTQFKKFDNFKNDHSDIDMADYEIICDNCVPGFEKLNIVNKITAYGIPIDNPFSNNVNNL